MINGYMAEATQGFATLEDIDTGTFSRFIRWMYSGDYAAAIYSTDVKLEEDEKKASKNSNSNVYDSDDSDDSTTIVLSRPITRGLLGSRSFTPTPTRTSATPTNSYYQLPATNLSMGTLSGNPRPKPRGKLVFDSPPPNPEIASHNSPKEAFHKLQYRVPLTRYIAPLVRSNLSPSEDYTEVFLSHAQVYVFAEKYDIRPLKMFALQRLHKTLSTYQLYHGRVVDITSLIRYTYANTNDSRTVSEPMRALLVHYVGSEMKVLVKSGEFKALLEEGGPFAGDFLGIVGKMDF